MQSTSHIDNPLNQPTNQPPSTNTCNQPTESNLTTPHPPGRPAGQHKPKQQVIIAEGDQAAPTPQAGALRRAFALTAGALLAQLAERNHRLEFCPDAAFVADGFLSERFHSEAAAVQLRLGEGGRQRLAQLLRFAPCLVPFQVRSGLCY